MDNQENVQASVKQQIAQRLKDASNVLVTVSNDPSVDQLASAIGLTLLLNKLGKHGTAVFSGQIPSTIEFLEPAKTIEKTTDSLRDFIIALDKAKADKLRYKVEDKLVKIFITPYRTSLSEKDFDFSQGDFNVDVVIALGVKQQEQLDQAIVSHGRILHDATVISLNTTNHVDLGTLNWIDSTASSLCEMVVALTDQMQDTNLLDTQMATVLLTGIVAETDRFSNQKTTPVTMNLTSKLMAAGANQQLVATKLRDEPPSINSANPKPYRPKTPGGGGNHDNGSLSIPHETKTTAQPADSEPPPEPAAHSSPFGVTMPSTDSPPERFKLPADSMTLPPVTNPLLGHNPSAVDESTASSHTPPVDSEDQTLIQLEKFVHSPHLRQPKVAGTNALQTPEAKPSGTSQVDPHTSSLTAARDAVEQVHASSQKSPLEALVSLYAQPMKPDDSHLSHDSGKPIPLVHVDDETGEPRFDIPPNLVPQSLPTDKTAALGQALAPPPVPPPMMPPSFNKPPVDQNPQLPPKQ
ncbi:hypothetical protein HY218_00995 [Candidatus Saccharibacteria bacterium]|nr:hypothetical protein [Candidatus Saccharibacteria bacterium]